MTVGSVLSVNVGVPRPNPAKQLAMTGIDKRPVDHPVRITAPGVRKGTSGLAGDPIGDTDHHGGDDQAVYAYAREDYDWWERELGRPLTGGTFGENLTTVGVDLTGALIGEVWRIGDRLELAATFGRIPCATFQSQMAEPQWVKRFARENRTGAYLRVVTSGEVRAGDPIEIVHRPTRGMTIAEAFRIYMHEPSELKRLLEADGLPEGLRADIERRLSRERP
jgi:MOSC domain-containing protein YiiM